jgi:hypothetical protein
MGAPEFLNTPGSAEACSANWWRDATQTMIQLLRHVSLIFLFFEGGIGRY